MCIRDRYEDFVNNFKLSDCLPGGQQCMMNAVNINGRPFMGPNFCELLCMVFAVDCTWTFLMIIQFSTNSRGFYYSYRLFSLSLTEYYLFFCRRYSARLVVLLIVSHLEILLMYRIEPLTSSSFFLLSHLIYCCPLCYFFSIIYPLPSGRPRHGRQWSHMSLWI